MDRKTYLSALLGLMVTGLLGLTAVGSSSGLLTGDDDGAAPLTPRDNLQATTPAAAPAGRGRQEL